jgi:beta-mannosidase
MTRISLDGDWQLSYFPEGERRVAHPDDLAAARAPTIPARMPGNVELDLQRAGVIPDPFYADHIRFDVTGALRPGETNRIAVRLGSVVNHARRYRYDASTMSWEHREEGLFIRKAPHIWGWDIMSLAVSAGIWRSIWLEPRPATAIKQIIMIIMSS